MRSVFYCKTNQRQNSHTATVNFRDDVLALTCDQLKHEGSIIYNYW